MVLKSYFIGRQHIQTLKSCFICVLANFDILCHAVTGITIYSRMALNSSESDLKWPNLAYSKNQRVPLDLWRCLHCPFNINIHSPAVTGAEHRHMLRQTPYFASPVVQYYPILSIATPSYQPYIEHSRSSRGSLWFLDPPNLGPSRHYSDLLLEL